MSGFSPAWLALREPADAAARAASLLEQLPPVAPGAGTADRPLTICDLGCGTGSMGRWLSPRLPGRQHWILYDHDAALLDRAAAALAAAGVTVETRQRDLTGLSAADLAGADLVTASALLDLLTVDEVERLAAACTVAGTPALLTLSVDGQARLHPADPLDATLGAAFNDHQRRRQGDRRLLGPDAVEVAAAAWRRHGATVRLAASPWRLGGDDAALLTEWLHGWVGAAVEQRPDLDDAARDYLARRHAALAAGELRVVVGHHDLLACPG